MQPRLRFNEFKDSWQALRLSEVSDVRDGTHDSPKYHNVGKPLVTSKNLLANGELDLFNVNLISQEDFQQVNKRSKVDVGDILFGMIGTIGNPVMVKNCDFAIKNVALIKETGNLKNQFLVHYLKSKKILTQVSLENVGNSQKFVSLSKVRAFEIFSPTPPEQTKIASFMSVVDEKITQLTKKHELLTQYKKGVMQKIFSQELRFKADDGSDYPDWEEKKLSDIGKITSGTGFPDAEQGGHHGVPFYKVSDMNHKSNTQEMTISNNYVSEKQISRLRLNPITKPAIIFAKVGAAIFLERKRKAQNFLIDNNMMAFIPSFNINFAKYLFDSIRLTEFAKVGALPSYNASDISTIQVLIPSADEQNKIANFLLALDDKLQNTQAQLEATKQYKQGLLQQMFV